MAPMSAMRLVVAQPRVMLCMAVLKCTCVYVFFVCLIKMNIITSDAFETFFLDHKGSSHASKYKMTLKTHLETL